MASFKNAVIESLLLWIFLIIFIKFFECMETFFCFFFISGMTHLFFKPVICTDIFDIFILFSCFNHDYWFFFVVVSFLLWFYVILILFFLTDLTFIEWWLSIWGGKLGKLENKTWICCHLRNWKLPSIKQICNFSQVLQIINKKIIFLNFKYFFLIPQSFPSKKFLNTFFTIFLKLRIFLIFFL